MVFTSCLKDKPSLKDGSYDLQLFIKYEDNLLIDMPVTISTPDYNITEMTTLTDSTGMANFENIPYADYNVNFSGRIGIPSGLKPGELDTILVTGADFVESRGEQLVVDTLYGIASGSQPGIKINELYTAGPVNNFYYFYDAFFEFYNSSDDTLYLDGIIICRMGKFLENVTSIFQFPGEPMGTTKDYPIGPGEFKVAALDAINHRDLIFGGEASIDLSNADFEFRNKNDYGDSDNPDVPNIKNLEVGNNVDFYVGVTGDVVLIADGSDVDYLDGIEMSSVIDAVEYSSKASHEKEIESELDRGFGGVGQSKYNGTSLERITKGFDTNNSTLDLKIIDAPTPGYQHE